LGKECLLFQLLRDDFLSLIVRSCWLVSFFFTPIYMFILVFIVVYGPKKGLLSTYYSFWSFKWLQEYYLIILNKNKACKPSFKLTVLSSIPKGFNYNSWAYLNNYSFQFSIVTCRVTTYILLTFWLFFTFFGENFFSIIFNFSNLTDTISSNFFLIFKTHTVFFLNNSSLLLSDMLSQFIFFFISCALIFLVNLKFTTYYNYLTATWIIDLLFLLIIFFIFSSSYVFTFIFALLLTVKNFKL
jgi:hypothetical protein